MSEDITCFLPGYSFGKHLSELLYDESTGWYMGFTEWGTPQESAPYGSGINLV